MKYLKSPFFMVNPKSYLYGEKILKLAKAVDEYIEGTDKCVVFTCPYADIRLLAENTKNIIVAAQHMDPIGPGRGMGAVLPESLKEAGAKAVVLNHAEHGLKLSDIHATIQKAKELELDTIVCADSTEESMAVAKLGPDCILAEPTALIGTGIAADISYTYEAVKMIKSVDPSILIMIGSGISTPEDVYNVVKGGADSSGATSGVIKAEDPVKMACDMVDAAIKGMQDR